jgi:hemerythrin superfamily protein
MQTSEPGDVIDVLLAQHEHVKTLFDKVQTAHGDDKHQLFADLVTLLGTHETGEQQTVHAALQNVPGTDTTVADARIAEEQEADQVLAELTAIGVDGDGFDTKFEQFHQTVLSHAGHEEDDEFPRLRQQLTTEQLQMMAAKLRSIQAMK